VIVLPETDPPLGLLPSPKSSVSWQHPLPSFCSVQSRNGMWLLLPFSVVRPSGFFDVNCVSLRCNFYSALTEGSLPPLGFPLLSLYSLFSLYSSNIDLPPRRLFFLTDCFFMGRESKESSSPYRLGSERLPPQYLSPVEPS